MVNDDVQDDDVDFESIRTAEDMQVRCKKELATLPDRIERIFQHDKPNKSIRVLQWNILSQCNDILPTITKWSLIIIQLFGILALGEHNDNFVCCPPEALDWRTRRYRIMEEIVEYGPDIICLQVSTSFR